jgi:hypothetical protein
LGTAKTLTFLTNSDNNLEGGTFRPRCEKPLACGVYKNPGHTNFWQEAVIHLRNMYLLWKIFWIKKTTSFQKKKLNENIGRIFGFILKFSRKYQV